jgi:D-alanyl-lipoteichoic acid acyltransferase DltB (MBOAT superfamily)
MVIADNLSIFVNKIYSFPENYSGFMLLLATLFFGFQIYCDFSGYVDIGRGIAKLLGINLVVNFKKPYLSSNITEFWRRWHISLSNWVRDYIYIPLGGSRKGKLRQYLNLLISWFVMGLWHGASLNFILWGVYHGLLLICHKIIKYLKSPLSLPRVISTTFTFFLVNMGWIFFRSNSIEEALYIFRKIFNPSLISNFKYQPGLLFSIYLILGLLFLEILDTKFDLKRRIIKANIIIFALFSSIIIYSIILFGLKEPINFIYLQF